MRIQSSVESTMAGALGSAVLAETLTPNDSNDLLVPCRAIYVGVSGDLKVDVGGQTVTFVSVPAGTILPILVTRVWVTGTTASALVGMQ